MKVVHGHRNAPQLWDGAAIAIGNFDGLHAGHRALIAKARALADARGAQTVAMTFDPHPSAILSPAGAPALLTSMARRLELFEAAGVDAVVVEPFNRALADISADAFVDDILLGALRARAVVVGYDFSYGQGRSGTVETLCARGGAAGVEVAVVPQVTVDGEAASSSRIRQLLRAGQLDKVTAVLGRWWDVDGVVVTGAQRGRAIGIPTANIAPEVELAIAPGIYAVTLAVDGGPALPAVASLGTNPTFVDAGKLVLEVHVLDWQGDIYGRRVRTTFVARLRDELKFTSVDALIEQIHADIAAARPLLA